MNTIEIIDGPSPCKPDDKWEYWTGDRIRIIPPGSEFQSRPGSRWLPMVRSGDASSLHLPYRSPRTSAKPASAPPICSDPIVSAHIAEHIERAQKSFPKYGHDLSRDDLTEEQWLGHAMHEMMDGGLYLRRTVGKAREREALVEQLTAENDRLDAALQKLRATLQSLPDVVQTIIGPRYNFASAQWNNFESHITGVIIDSMSSEEILADLEQAGITQEVREKTMGRVADLVAEAKQRAALSPT